MRRDKNPGKSLLGKGLLEKVDPEMPIKCSVKKPRFANKCVQPDNLVDEGPYDKHGLRVSFLNK